MTTRHGAKYSCRTTGRSKAPFDEKYNARCGGPPSHGAGCYRKKFATPDLRQDQRVAIAFDGAMYNAQVWVNGTFVGRRPYDG